MDNPRYTAKQLNVQLAKTSLIRVSWDGDETRDEPQFWVWVGDENTMYIIEDLDHTFEISLIVDGDKPRCDTIGSASGYHKIATLLTDIINEDIEAGRIVLPEQED